MSRYQFELATPADDEQLRRILADTPMEGAIAVSFCREPSYFQAAVVDGRCRQVVAARDAEIGRIIGCGSRSISERYVNGRLQPIGYLSALRLLPTYRNRGLVARGYAYFRRLHADGQTVLYLTTIAAGNHTAVRTLTTGRAGLPAYHFCGAFHTLVIPRRRSTPKDRIAEVDVRPATAADAQRISAFLAEHGPRRQFFPRYEVEDLFADDRALHGLRPTDLLLARDGSRLVGTLAGWDQRCYRQSVIHSYDRRLRWFRPVYNGWAAWRRRPRLPPAGRPFQYLTAALGVVADDDPTVFAALLRSLLGRAAPGGVEHLLLGMHERDPLLPVARRFQVASYTTHLYLVCWEDGEALRASLDDRPPYLELGSL